MEQKTTKDSIELAYLRFRRRSRREDDPESFELFNIATLLPTTLFSPDRLNDRIFSLSSSSSIAFHRD